MGDAAELERLQQPIDVLGCAFNAFPALKDGDFCNQRVAFHPEQ